MKNIAELILLIPICLYIIWFHGFFVMAAAVAGLPKYELATQPTANWLTYLWTSVASVLLGWAAVRSVIRNWVCRTRKQDVD